MNELKKEDYVEPNCPLCEEPYGVTPELKPIPQQRIVQKMDEYMARRDYAGAERHLKYWLEEAKLGHDLRGELLLRNEMIGFYRKRARKEETFESIDEAFRLLNVLDFEGTISAGTTYTNAATACNVFGENERAITLFEKACTVYEASPNTDPSLLGGLYNNMALVLVALGRFDEAKDRYQKALALMENVPGGWLECAITYCNLANALEAEKGLEAAEPEIFDLLDKAYELFDTPGVGGPGGPSRGYYAFVCESCAPTFAYYGYFLAAQDLEQRAKENYAQ
ncbi:MAG: tetratricopeptide repeat protein [Lachnospiraceae bacterium]|nr:tetratricopeptide repeat protein [Lachnospiraceae bacterium]